MNVHVTAEMAKKLSDLAAATGRAPDELVEDALAGYIEELNAVRESLDRRYDELKSGVVKAVDGEEALKLLRARSTARRNE